MPQFKLQAKFSPKGDQPQAITELVQGLKNNLHDQTLLGVTGSGKTFTMANIIAQVQRPTLIISHNKTLAAQLAEEFKDFFPKNAVNYFVSYYDYYQPEAYIPQSDTYIEKETSLNEEIDRLRHASTQALLSRSDVIIVASVSCIYGLGSPSEYKAESLEIKIGQKIAMAQLARQLNKLRYTRNDYDFFRGRYRLKGDTLDIYQPYALDEVTRIEFFGQTIENISLTNYLTGKKITNLEGTTVFPASHYLAPAENFKKALRDIKNDLRIRLQDLKKKKKLLEAQRLEERTIYDLEMMEQTGYCNGIENYSRYFDGRKIGEPPYTLLDFFPENYLLFIDESHMTIPQIRGMYAGDQARKKTLIDFGFRLPSALDNRPLNFKEFLERTSQTIYVSATPQDWELTKSKNVVEQLVRPTGLLDPDIEIKPTKNQIDDLIEQIRQRIKKNQRVLVTTLTKRLSEDLANHLQEIGLKAYYLHSEVETFERIEIIQDLRLGKYDVLVGINLLREGLDLPEVSLIAILDADKEGYLRSDTALIQTMGRAARHIDGHVIMYADRITGSMKRAIEETKRRRKIQQDYNKKNKITPESIQKEIKELRFKATTDKRQLTNNQRLTLINKIKSASAEEIRHIVNDLTEQMELAAKNLEFEKAADLRDEIEKLKKGSG